MDHSSEEETWSLAMQLVTGAVLPAALKCAAELDLFELIKKAGPGPAPFVSPAELATQLPATNPEAPVMLDRILRVLAANSILNCSVGEQPDGSVERLYSLAPVCKFFTRDDDGVSMAPLLLLNQDKVFMETWYHLKDTVLEGGTPFNRAHGMSVFEYPAADPRFNKNFNKAMSQQSTLFIKKILQVYNGFEGLTSLVDVGGGIGASLNLIVSKYPYIKGINFDLPHVIQHAPSHPGVEHIGGDMFVGVPRGDAIFLKWICHDWSDAKCLKILRNCYEAIPGNGKVIIAEWILSVIPNRALSSSLGFTADLIMLAFSPGGKERTKREFHTLAKESGFKEFRQVCSGFGISIMEFYK